MFVNAGADLCLPEVVTYMQIHTCQICTNTEEAKECVFSSKNSFRIPMTLFLLNYGHLELLYFLILTSKVYLSVHNVFFLKYIFIYLAPLGLICSVWNLVPQPGVKLKPPTLRAWGLSHWTAKEVPVRNFLYWLPLPIVLGFSRKVESVECGEGWMEREREIYF